MNKRYAIQIVYMIYITSRLKNEIKIPNYGTIQRNAKFDAVLQTFWQMKKPTSLKDNDKSIESYICQKILYPES